MNSHEDEFDYGRGKRSSLDNFSLSRYWQKGYGVDRFSPAYITSCHSTAPQAVFKIISFGKGLSSVKGMLEYVNYRPGKKIHPTDLDDFDKIITDENGDHYEANAQEFYTESGEVLKGKEDINDLYKTWSDEFRLQGSGRGEQRHLTHMLLSADVEPLQRNANNVLAAAQKTLWEEFGQFGFEYTYVLHTDTENPHVHCILKNYNNHSKKKLRLDRHDLLRIRTEFGNQLTDRGLKKHIATLRRDRPETLLRVQDVISKIKNQEKLIRSTVNESAFYQRKSQLNAQLTKQIKIHNYSGLSIKFDSGVDQLKIIANKPGAHVEKILKHLAFDLGSKSFKLGLDETATINITDIQDLSLEQRKLAKTKFENLLKEKEFQQDKKLTKKVRDVWPQYQSALIRINRSIKWIKKSKQLSALQKQDTLVDLKEIKRKLLNNYDINEIKSAHLIVSGRIGAAAAKEMLHIEDRNMDGKEFKKRYVGLQAYVKQQKDQLKEQIKTYKDKGDQEIVKQLKGLRTAKGHKEYIAAQSKVKRKVLERRSPTI